MTPIATAEVRRRTDAVLYASLNANVDAATAGVLGELAAGAIDWTDLIAIGLEHRLVPALLRPLTDPRAVDLVPQELIDAIVSYCDAARERNRYLVTALCELLGALEREGIPAIAFKGVLLAELLYHDLGERPAGDLDFLIRAEDVARARSVLAGLGYLDVFAARGAMTPVQRRMYERYQCEYELSREHDHVIVEPHWAYAPRWLAPHLDYGAVFERSRLTMLWNTSVRVHSAEDLLIALCIHGTKHEWERLSWIRDVAALLAGSPTFDYALTLARAREAGCARVVLLGLNLARTIADAPLPSEVMAHIRQTAVIERLTGHICQVLTSGHGGVQAVWPDRYGWELQDRAAGRLRYLGAAALPPRAVHVELIAFPAPIQFLYFPLRWIYDYLARPLWLLSRRFATKRVTFRAF